MTILKTAFAARLKPCPDTRPRHAGSFPKLLTAVGLSIEDGAPGFLQRSTSRARGGTKAGRGVMVGCAQPVSSSICPCGSAVQDSVASLNRSANGTASLERLDGIRWPCVETSHDLRAEVAVHLVLENPGRGFDPVRVIGWEIQLTDIDHRGVTTE